jgi:SAM-dependent methyltransferase
MSFIVSRKPRLPIFQEALEIDDWKGLKILDYGGNMGNILQYGIDADQIDPADYTCIDVDKQALAYGRECFPEATWIHYDRFNEVYNTDGKEYLKFPFEDSTFDIACAYSVHSHASYEAFKFDLLELKRVSNVVATSFVDIRFIDILRHKRQKEYEKVALEWRRPFPLETYRYYVNGTEIYYTKDEIPKCDYLITCYNRVWLKNEHPEITIVAPFNSHHQAMLVLK